MSGNNPPLKCYCDHCPNNTCTTHSQGSCYVRILINRNGETERQSNCFNPKEQLFQNLICGKHRTKISTDITRCCYSKDYCNLDVGILTEIEEAEKSFLSSNLVQNGVHDHNIAHEAHIASSNIVSENYSKLPLELKLASITIFGLVVITVIALAQRWYSNRSTKSRKNDENYLENSSIKVNKHGTIVYDTNSMASKEPLLCNGICKASSNPNGSSHMLTSICIATAQNHPGSLKDFSSTKEIATSITNQALSTTIGACRVGESDLENSSGSGSGQPYLTQRSIAHDIELLELVGRGYFGVVWRARYKGEPVAVKIFTAEAEPSWEREASIYQTTLLRHKNILGFIASDKRDGISMTGYWLVTDYYPLGSLYDFLKINSLSIADALRMAFTISNGLAHLHTEIFGTQAKPAIAHRDIKSKNILVKNDGTCCIADLGMAIRYNSSTNIVDVPANTRVGTRRYLSPEILKNHLDLMDFEGVKSSDIYSLGLVFWEILRRACYKHSSSMPSSNCTLDHLHHTQPASIESSSSGSSSAPSIASKIPNLKQDSPTINLQVATTAVSQQSSSTEYLVSSESPPQQMDHPAFAQSNNDATSLTQGGSNKEMKLTFNNQKDELSKVCDTYEVPYQGYVSLDPTAEEMYQCVCVKKIRPPLSYRWTLFPPMRDFSTIMRECWYDKPQARLSALRIRKTLGAIARHYLNQNMEYD